MLRVHLPQRPIGKPALDERSDEELLSHFLTARDQCAFAALVGRYERMVLYVCARVLNHRQDAEDACQAVFIVFWRKAGLIRDSWKLKNWLHGVAHREALRIRRNKKRRETHENLCAESTLPYLAQPIDEGSFGEFQTLLNVAMQNLPLKYRSPVMLCFLEGYSKAEAAAELGWPEGTVSCRLVRGRKLLQRWLESRGVGPSWI